MMENKDLAIKLFGMKIPLSAVLAEEQEDVISSEKKQNETLTEKDNKTLKKPTKIIPCPRCKSMETKFCYYNNYNVNQPRHFCKACQRYWTSGGTMRSVPVGAGRRKNKNNSSSSSPYHHVTISEPNGPVLSSSLGDINQQKDKEMNIGLDCFQGVSWPYTWNPDLYPVYPYWNVPIMSSSSYNSNPSSIVTSLGKHAREENETMRRKKMNGTNVLVPKTLRIDDPNEAAKSSIWTTLGIKNDVMFKGFDSKKEINNNKEETETSLILLSANPAALSRSNNFREHM